MNWNLKERKRAFDWRNFFNRKFFQTSPLEADQIAYTYPVQECKNLLDRVTTPRAQKIFAGLHNYLTMKITKESSGIILVCTANPGEGASSVALGLAIAAARDQRDKILLIDGNFYHPCLSQSWSLPSNPGFSDLITGLSNDLELPQKTKLGNLWVLGGGSTIESQSRDIEQEPLREILTTLVHRFTMVIIDGPPLNTHSESTLYAQYAKYILLVVAGGLSRAPVVNNAISKLPFQVRDKMEVVLNRRIYPIPETLYRKLWTS